MSIAVLDNDLCSREGLKSILGQSFSHIDFIYLDTFTSLEKQMGTDSQLDCLLYSTTYPVLEHYKDMNRLSTTAEALPFVVLAPATEGDFRQQAILSGANGFIDRNSAPESLINALQTIFSGRSHYDKAPRARPSPKTFSQLRMTRLDRLTARQKQVLLLLGQGYSNQDIADDLEIALNTVRIHVASVLRILNLKNRTEAAILVTQLRDAGHILSEGQQA